MSYDSNLDVTRYIDTGIEGTSNEEIGIRIYIIRKELNLTQKELAEMAGISIATLKKAEKGIHKPTPATLLKLSEALNVTYEFLRYGKRNDFGPLVLSTVPNVAIPITNNRLELTALTPIISDFLNSDDIGTMGDAYYNHLEMTENEINFDNDREEQGEKYIVYRLLGSDFDYIKRSPKALEGGAFVVYDSKLQWFYPVTFKVHTREEIEAIGTNGTKEATSTLNDLISSNSDLYIYGQLKMLIRTYM
jgi:transcriptional regulator with XRE-family HTH domain